LKILNFCLVQHKFFSIDLMKKLGLCDAPHNC
jgi:hypothetical protein